ncbi:HNH endonuclease signature motif containing protein [Mycobacteroides sp. PCS013]|uniref:HNH endonuclease signature motif containing protein n=1 Tax=Mycobacteroides sp. PCS013 TaxID=3074106 RepID=UPI003C2EF2B9
MRTGKLLVLDATSTPYPRCVLDGQKVKVHHAVLAAFVGPRPEGMLVLHSNDDPSDNRLENLRYGTISDNQMDSVANGSHYEAALTHCLRGHEFTEDNIYRAPNAPRKRGCRACHRERVRGQR